jgi:hypothetical protein
MLRNIALFASFNAFVATSGCATHHVQLQAPESDAPIAARLEAYKQLKPVSISETHITTLNKWGAPIAATHLTDSLQLQGGERVYEPEDLWPVIAQTSAAANAIQNYEDKSSTVRTVNWISAGLMTVGLGLTGYSVFHHNSDGSRNMTPMYVGIGFLTGGTLALFWANTEAKAANDDKATAFEVYDEGLRSKLNLCDADGRASDCNQPKARETEKTDKKEPSSSDDN